MSTTLGPFAFATTHLIFILSSAAALTVAWYFSRALRVNLGDAVFRIIAVGLISARLYFVIKYIDIYLDTPWQIVNLRDGGFALWAGLCAGILWTVGEFVLLRRQSSSRETEESDENARHLRGPFGLVIALLTGLIAFSSGQIWLNQQTAQTQLPPLSLHQLSGHPIDMAEAFYGQPTVVNLWASWCPPCVREMPLLQDAADNWPDIHIVAVNQGEDRAQVATFLQQQQIDLPLVLLDETSQTSELIGSHALPTTLFFNSDGSLNYTHVGEFSAATLENALRRLN